MTEPAKLEDPARRPSVRVRALALLASLVVALLLGEVVVRLLPEPRSPHEPSYVKDPAVGYRPRPGFSDGTVKINARGLRDDAELADNKTPGEVRVLFLGDSFLYAAHVAWKDTMPARVAAALGPHARALDAGCPGWSAPRERAFFEHFGAALAPDAVVLCVFVGNDVMEALSDARFHVNDDHSIEVRVRTPGLWRTALESSALFRRIQATALYQRIAHPRKAEKQAGGGNAERYYEVEQLRVEQWRKGAWTRPPLADGWRRVAEELEKLRDLARERRIPLAVAIIPDEAQVDPAIRDELVRRANPPIDLRDYDLEHPQREVTALAAKLGVPCVDLLPALRAKGGAGLHRKLDTHWNEAGHGVAADAIAPAVRALLDRR